MAVEVVQSVAFGRQGDDVNYLGPGWSAPEDGFRWMVGKESELWLDNPGNGDSFALEVEAVPYCKEPTVPWQQLAVAVRGTVVGQSVLKKEETIAYRVPADILAAKGPLRITFGHPDAARPVDNGHPNDERLLAIALRRLKLYRLTGRVAQPNFQGGAGLTVAELEAATGLPAAQFMLQFESLGDNCEFGLVQRRCGAEPLGLLRFSNIRLASLINAVESDFEDLGDPKNMDFWQDDSLRREYVVRDKTWSLVFHTFLYDGQVDESTLLDQQATRMKFLRRKLLEDIANGEKIFVLKRNHPINEADVLPLFLKLNRHAANTLMWVVPADEQHSPGTVEQVIPGLLRGYIDRFAPYDNAHDLSFDVWLRLCLNARQLVPLPRAAETAAGAAPIAVVADPSATA